MAKFGFNVTIGADTRPFASALRALNQPISDAQKTLSRINEGLKLNPTNMNMLTAKFKTLDFQMEQTQDKLRGLKEARDNLINSANGKYTEEQYQTLQKLNAEIAVTEEELKQLQREYRNFGSVAAQQLIAVGNQVKDVGNKVTELGKKLSRISTIAAGALIGIVKTSADFEDAWVGVTKTVDGTAEELAQVRQEIIDMSKTTGISKNEIAGVAQVAGQLGIATNDLSSFTKVMVDLGIATDMTAEDAAMNLARLANITQMSADDYDRLGATITALGNNYAVTESEIVEMATRLAATGDLVGLNQSQIMALSAAMGSLGSEAEAGGTAMSKIFKKMQLAIETNNEQLPKFAKVAGMSVNEFKEAYEKDALGALNAFTKGLAKIESEGGSAVATLDDMKLSEVRLSDALLRLVGSGDLLDRTIATANTAWEDNTALTNEAKKRYEELNYQWGQVKETIGDLVIDLGETLLPIVKEVLEKVKEWVEKFTNLSDGSKKVILIVLAIIAALGPFVMILGTIITSIGALIIGLGLLGVGLAAITAPVAIVVAAIAAVVAIVIHLWRTNEDFRNNVMNIWNGVTNFFKNVILPFFSGFLGTWVGWFKDAITKIIGVVKGLLTNATTIINGVIGVFSGFITYLTGVFTGDWKKVWEGIKDIFVSIIETIKGLFSGFIDGIKNQIQGLIDKVTSIPDKIRSIRGISVMGHDINIPGFATGGIVTRPTLAMVGEGGSSEAIIPLNSLPAIMAEAMEKVGGTRTINIYTQELDSQKLEQIVTYVDRRFGSAF